MSGAENLNLSNYATLRALLAPNTLPLSGQSLVQYYFDPAGVTVDKGTYSGGSDLTKTWSTAEKQQYRDVMDRVMEFTNINITQTATRNDADIYLQMVDDVPGGWGGYAGGTTFVVGSANSGLISHEFGHILGLGHPHDTSLDSEYLPGVTGSSSPGDFGFNTDFYTTMAYRHANIPEFGDARMHSNTNYSVLDIAALQYLYGTNDQFASGDTSYQATGSFTTIWDSGGIDTIDFSDQSTDTVIDLRAANLKMEAGGLGHLSVSDIDGSFQSPSSGYLIAYGVRIENGSGGDGNDSITGNSAANLLIGGIGDDEIFGGSGNDTINSGPDQLATLDFANLNNAGQSDEYLKIQSFSGFDGAGLSVEFTLSFELAVGEKMRLMSFLPDNSSDLNFDLELLNSGGDTFLSVVYRNGATVHKSSIWLGGSGTDLSEPFVLSVSRDTVSGTVTAYVNGEEAGSTSIMPGQGFASSGTFVVGQSQGVWGSAFDSAVAFSGQIGRIALYDAVLTDAELQSHTLMAEFDDQDTRLTDLWLADSVTGQFNNQLGAQDLSVINGVDFARVALTSDNDVVDGWTGDDQIDAGAGDDLLRGGEGNDLLLGRSGVDTLGGNSGDDQLFGGAGNDRLFGGAGNDDLNGGSDNDLLKGGLGDDLLRGSYGADQLYGDDGTDVLSGGSDDDSMRGGRGDDRIFGGAGDDLLSGNSGHDTLNGGGGDDRIFGGSGRDILNGDSGADRLDGGYQDDILRGGSDNDILFGRNDNDTLSGNSGADRLYGGQGNDRLFGGSGADTLKGGSGNDLLAGGTGSDSLTGESGADTFVFETYAGTDTVTDFTDGSDMIRYTGGTFADLSITAASGNVDITGANGGHMTLLNTDLGLITADDFIF